MPPISRLVIRIHHMTSTKKIRLIRSAANQHRCSVLLRISGKQKSPGVILAEGEEAEVDEFLKFIKKLRYKDYALMRKEVVSEDILGRLIWRGNVVERDSMKDFVKFLDGTAADEGSEMEGKERERRRELVGWWRKWMGFDSGDGNRLHWI